MADIKGKCPECGNVLTIPADLQEFSCLYCGKKLNIADLLPTDDELRAKKEKQVLATLESLYEGSEDSAWQMQKTLLGMDPFDLGANAFYAKKKFSGLVTGYPDAMQSFTRTEYAKYFDDYRRICRPVIESIDKYSRASADGGDRLMHELAVTLSSDVDQAVRSTKSRKDRGDKEYNLKMTIIVYLIPAITDLKLTCSEMLTDIIVEEWCRTHPKSPMKKGTFADFEAGFRKGKMCFITTAVCASCGLPDDCEELTSLRAFRDSYLEKTPEGHELVLEYYDVAPGIVMCIDQSADPGRIYSGLLSGWIRPCLCDIAAGEYESCRDRYIQMVGTLKRKYLGL